MSNVPVLNIAPISQSVNKKIVRSMFNGKMVGERCSDGVYRKGISFTKHLLRLFGGAIGVDSDIVRTEILPHCHRIDVTNRDDSKVYSVSVDVFHKQAIEKNFGSGLQMFLPLRFWAGKDSRQLDFLEVIQ